MILPKYRILPCLLLVSALCFAQDQKQSQIEALLQEIDPTGPGISVGVVDNGTLRYTLSRGVANLDYGTPLSETTNFRLSSTSKQFTAACIMRLMEDGSLRLEDPVGKFFPDLFPKVGQVTVRQLLNHTSGIRDYMSLMMLQGSDKVDFFNSFTGDDGDIMALLSRQRDLSFASGTEHGYSNTNYWLLGQIVGQVSGKSLGEYAREHLFGPLEMPHSGFAEVSGRVTPQRAAGYVSPCPGCERMEYRDQPTAVGDAGVVSSIRDLVRWETAFHQGDLLSERSWRAMLRPGRLTDGTEITYAAGLIVDTFNGVARVSHSGETPGFSSEILRFPDHRLSIIVLGNQNWHDTRQYASAIAELFFPAETVVPEKVVSLDTEPIALSPAEMERFCGDYYFPETNEYRAVELIEGELHYIRSNGPNSKLVPTAGNRLFFTDRPRICLAFTFAADGKKQVIWQDGGRVSLHATSYQKVPASEADKQALVAEYRSEELGNSVRIDRMGDGLVLHLGEHPIPLSATTRDKFVGGGMFTLLLERDDAGGITGFRLNAPRARRIAFTRVPS